MADKDVQALIDQINSAARGEDVRDAIIELLKMANTGTANAYTLNGLDSSMFAKQSDMDQILPLATEPTESGTRPIGSGDLYTYLNDNIIQALNIILYGIDPDGPSAGTIESKIEDIALVRKKIGNAIANKGQPVTAEDTFESFYSKINNIHTESNYEIDSLSVTENGTYHPEEGDHAWRTVEVEVKPDLATKTISNPGTYKAKDDDKDGYSEVTVELSTGIPGSETAALIEKSIDRSNLPEPGASSLTKTFLPKDDGAKAVGYSKVTVNLDSIVGERPDITVDASTFGESQTFEAKDDGLYGYSKITVVVKEASGPFKVEFWNESSKWEEVIVDKYDYATPSRGNPTAPSGKDFVGWEPNPICVTRDMKCYAQFKEHRSSSFSDEVQESWQEIAQNGGANIRRGEYKMLYFASFRYNGMDFSGGGIPMIKVAPCDPDDPNPDSNCYSKGNSTSTWISACRLGVMPGSPSYYNLPLYQDSITYSQLIQKGVKKEDGSGGIGWDGSDLQEFLNGEFLNSLTLLDGDVNMATYIKPVENISYCYRRVDDQANYSVVVNGSSTDRIWVPSYREVSWYTGWATNYETIGPHYTLPESTTLPSGYTKSWGDLEVRSMSNVLLYKGQHDPDTTVDQFYDKFITHYSVRADTNFSGNRSYEILQRYDPQYLSAWNTAYPSNPKSDSYQLSSGGILIGFCT